MLGTSEGKASENQSEGCGQVSGPLAELDGNSKKPSAPEETHRDANEFTQSPSSLKLQGSSNGDPVTAAVQQWWRYAAVVVVICGICVGLYLWSLQPELTIVEKFNKRIETLKFQSPQDERFWRVVSATASNHIADENPRQPNVLMLVSTSDVAKKREMLASEIAKAYSVRCNGKDSVLVNGYTYESQEHGEVKQQIDHSITEKFNDNACAAVISNFEKLPPPSTLIFYKFCENDHAPFKNVTVIFTVEIDHGPWDTANRYESLKHNEVPEWKKWHRIVDKFLYYTLQDRDETGQIRVDVLAGLMTRITPSIVWVREREAPNHDEN